MRYRTVIVLMVAAASVVGCTTTGSTPATAPDTTAPSATEPPTTSSADESTSTVATTTVAPSTTVDRLTEIQAIFEDLERRRLEAIYTGDVEAFRSLFADTPYLEESLAVFDVIEPGPVPDIELSVIEVLKDEPDCLALYYQSIHGDGSEGPRSTVVFERSGDTYMYAFTNDGRGGWLCDGPHPLS